MFVFDYDLEDNTKNGIDLIQEFDLVMTNYYDDLLVQTKALNANVRIFPKGLIEYLGRGGKSSQC